MPKLKTVFAGSPRFAAMILERLADTAFRPAAVFTQPDRPKGRGRKIQANPVKKLAESLDLEILQPASLKGSDPAAQLARFEPDVFIVAAYGLILPPSILDVPAYGCLNVHASLLPRWRGAAPIERAMMAGDVETGVCIMKMEAGLDTGPVYASRTVPIDEESTASQLEDTLADLGADELMDVLRAFRKAKAGKAEPPVPIAQDETRVTYAEKLTMRDRVVDWNRPAAYTARQIMALSGRLPVRVFTNDCAVQFLSARAVEQALPREPHIRPGTLLDASKQGLLIQCAIDLLQIKSLKVERGKGKALDPAAAVNGFKDLFYPGAQFV